MRGRRTLHAAVAASITFCIAGAAYAQSRPARTYIVTTAKITLKECEAPDKISAVIGQVDSSDDAIKKSNERTWTVEFEDSADRFDADATYARAFFGSKTTDCQKSHPDKRGDLYVGSFTLTCQSGKTRKLTVLAPAARFHYVRKMNTASDCWQGELFREERDLRGFLASNESIRLQFGNEKPDPRAPGLLINDPAVLADPRNGVGAKLDRNKILDALASQRDRGLQNVVPTNSPNARVFDEKNTAAAGLKTIQFEFKDN